MNYTRFKRDLHDLVNQYKQFEANKVHGNFLNCINEMMSHKHISASWTQTITAFVDKMPYF